MEKRFYWLYITVFINVIGIGMIFPILPLFAKTYNATLFEVGLLTSTLALVQFLISPLLGKLSDKYGRKPILLSSVGVNALSFLITGSAPSLAFVFLGMVLQGIGTAGVLPAALAYIADITKGHDRSTYISRVTGTFALGFMVGPVVGGILSSISLHFPFFVAFFIGLFNLLIIKTFLQETLTEKDKSIVLRQGLINVKPLFTAAKGEFGILFLLLFAWAVYISNFSLTVPFFTLERFGFQAFHNGLLFSLTGMTAAITQWVILPKIEKRFGDLKTMLYGQIVLIIGLILTPFAPITLLFVGATVFNVFGSSILRPSINSYLSKKTTTGQGSTMGLAFSFESLGRVVGPLVMGGAMTRFGTSLPFFLSAFTLFVGLMFFLKIEYKNS